MQSFGTWGFEASDAPGRISDSRAVEPLRRLLDGNTNKVRDAAARALDAIAQVFG